MIFPGVATQSGARIFTGQSTLTEDDVAAIKAECPSVAYVSPVVAHRRRRSSAASSTGARRSRASASTGRSSAPGTSTKGAFFGDSDVRAGGQGLRPRRDGRRRPLRRTATRSGQTVRIKNVPFRVVGVLETKGGSTMGQDQDDTVIAPYTTVMKLLEGAPRRSTCSWRRRSRRERGGRGAEGDRGAAAPAPPARGRARTPTS